MKAIQIDEFVKDFSELRPKDVQCQCKSNQLGVQITHAAVTHVDMLYAQGLHQNNRRHVKPPFILGNEFAGTTTSSPPNSSFPPGTRVFGSALGSYATHICVSETAVKPVPSQWTNAEACAVGASGAISYGGLMDVGNLQRGQWVLILGATGGLGVMAIQIAKAVGARVIAAVADGEAGEKGRMVRRIGADVVVDFQGKEWEGRVREATDGGEGVHLVYDSIGAVESGIRCCRYRGRIVIVGFAARGGEMEMVKMNRVLLKGISVVGYRFGEDGRRDPEKTKQAWKGFMGLVEAGKIRPVIYSGEYKGLESLPRALEDLKERKAWGRSVLRISEEAGQTDKSRL
ncbi:zeta-crystallin [Sporormia fimetaria CBS 119925]|uniref:Zeta-crystallin n=1 Tax=Sporormia fimetaria CBS 119925 TaxID=1340428 RepID=A0A6A6UUJ8_9PLEO|nr:zeta-crystallin [Sporormia fimetaria CBS 119925]